MVVAVRAKSQITLPSKLVKSLEIKEGDEFEAVERDGGIFLVPVVTYPRAYVEHLEKEFDQAAKELDEGVRPAFDSAKEMMEYLEAH